MRITWKLSLVLGLFTLVASCDDGGPGEAGIGGGFGDAGDTGRITIDPDGGGKEVAASDGPSKVDGLDLTLSITEPLADAVITATDSFKPEVVIDVLADTQELLMGFTINDVTAQVIVPNSMVAAPATKLGQLDVERPSEGLAAQTYTFGGALLSMKGVPSGNLQLKITVTTNKGDSTKMVPFRYDGGPTITFVVPAAENTSFKDSAPITFSVADLAFPPVSEVKAFIGDVEQTLDMPDGLYKTTIDFKSFVPRLSGRQLLTVRAKNGNGTSSVMSLAFIADDVGPTFTKLSPEQGQLIGNIITIVAELDDPAGVDPQSVVAVIGNGNTEKFEVRLDPPAVGMSPAQFKKSFDTRVLPLNAIYPSISFRASDKLGNENSKGYGLSLDNMPPLLDLDPPGDFRFETLEQDGKFHCSWPLDPVGPDAVDDGQYVNQAFDIRVRAEDQGNEVKFGTIDYVPIGGVSSVQLVALDDTNGSLLVDTDDDQVCDSINPLLVPTTRPTASNQMLLLNMEPLPKTGGPDKTPETPPPPPELCMTNGGTVMSPPGLCDGSNATYNRSKVIYDSFGFYHYQAMTTFVTYAQENLPAIWALGPVRAGLECAGRQLESVGTNLSDGWACFAAVGQDGLGLKQVSRPIRVCIDADGDRKECPHTSIVAVTSGSPIEITTLTDHGLANGDAVLVQSVLCQTGANGSHVVTVTGAKTFTLNGVAGRTDLTFPQVPECKDAPAASGLVVAKRLLPDCTGKQTAPVPNITVDDSKICKPWRDFKAGEFRVFK